MLRFVSILNHLKKIEWGIVIPALLLAGIGLMGIYSTCLARGVFFNFYKQIIFLLLGVFLMLLLSFLDYRIFKNNSYLILAIYIISVLLLLGLYFFAPITRGTRGWYRLGIFSFDPTELAKISLVLLLSKYFSMRHREMYNIRHLIFSGIYVLIPFWLVFKKPDFGGALILLLIWVIVLIISGIKTKHLIFLLIIFLVFSVLGWNFLLKDYQKERIFSFLFPAEYVGASWSQRQAEISIGSGQIFGKGLGKGTQVQYGFLPEPHTDFIFSVIAEEGGLIAVLIVFFLYGFLIWRILRVAVRSYSNFPRLFTSGYVVILILQFSFNIGMNLSLLPVVGIYLPFISYGGSALLGNFVFLGIIQSIKCHS